MTDKIITVAGYIGLIILAVIVVLIGISDTKSQCQVYKDLENRPIKCQINENITR